MKIPALLIPPRRMTVNSGRFTFTSPVVLATAAMDDLTPLRQAAAEIGRHLRRPCRIALNAWGPSTVRVMRDPAMSGRDAYRLAVTPSGVEIRSSAAPGAYYGIQTLRELVRLHGEALPLCVIEDWPDFRRRGVYLDCSRGKVPTVETLKMLIEQLAAWKINELQLYIENVFTFGRHPAIGRGFDPFTPGELLQVQEHCRQHHVCFVPSLSSFGHMERVLDLPEYAALGEKPGYRDYRGGTTLCPLDPRSIRLMEELYAEFLPLFDSEDFNACCDETWELGKGRSRSRADRLGVGRVYLDFVLKLRRLCHRHGKRMNVWADIVLKHPELVPEIPKDVVMLNWDYSPDGTRIAASRTLAEAGLPFLVCPGTSGWQTHGTRLDNAIRNVAVFAAEGRRRGAEGLLNTDWGDWGHRNPLGVSLHGFAHGAAHAWNGRQTDDDAFTTAFCRNFFGAGSEPLASAIRVLGGTADRTGCTLYHILGESVDGRRNLFRGVPTISPVRVPVELRDRCIEKASVAGVRRTIADLQGADSCLRFNSKLDPLALLALQDLHLSARMDAVACRKILVARDLRGGENVSATALRSLGDEIWATARQFETNWQARNKPSRLADNMRLFGNAAEELWALARLA